MTCLGHTVRPGTKPGAPRQDIREHQGPADKCRRRAPPDRSWARTGWPRTQPSWESPSHIMAQKARVRRFWPSLFSPFRLWAPLARLLEFVLNSKNNLSFVTVAEVCHLESPEYATVRSEEPQDSKGQGTEQGASEFAREPAPVGLGAP